MKALLKELTREERLLLVFFTAVAFALCLMVGHYDAPDISLVPYRAGW